MRVIVGYLVTLPDGYECRLGRDYARALHYAARQHGRIDPMFVERDDNTLTTAPPAGFEPAPAQDDS